MLTFFRKIRKGLLDMGAARKYLLYAIGEVIFIFIGITLAIAFHNSNEERKDNDLKGLLSTIIRKPSKRYRTIGRNITLNDSLKVIQYILLSKLQY